VQWTRVPARSSKAPSAILGWALFWVGFGVLDAKVPVQFSHVIRGVCNTETPLGKAKFLILLGAAVSA